MATPALPSVLDVATRMRPRRAIVLAVVVMLLAIAMVSLVVAGARPWPGGTVTHLDAQLQVPAGWQMERIPAQGPVVCATFEDPPTVWLFEDQFEAGCLIQSPEMGIQVFRTGAQPGLVLMPLGSVPWEEADVRANGEAFVVNGVRGVSTRVVDRSGAHVQVVIFDELGLHVRASSGRDGRDAEVEGMLGSISAAPRGS